MKFLSVAVAGLLACSSLPAHAESTVTTQWSLVSGSETAGKFYVDPASVSDGFFDGRPTAKVAALVVRPDGSQERQTFEVNKDACFDGEGTLWTIDSSGNYFRNAFSRESNSIASVIARKVCDLDAARPAQPA